MIVILSKVVSRVNQFTKQALAAFTVFLESCRVARINSQEPPSLQDHPKPMHKMKNILLPLIGIAALGASAHAQTWNISTGGNWDVDTNWNPNTIPNAIGANASITNLTDNGTYDITASSPQTFTVGRLDFGSNSVNVDLDMSLNSNVGLIFDVASGSAQLNLGTGGNGSTMIINSSIQLNDNTTVTLSRNGSTQIVPVFNGAINLQSNTLTFGTRQAGIAFNGTISGTGGIMLISQGTNRTTVFNNSASTFSGGVSFDNGGGNVIQLGSGSTYTSNATQGIVGTGTITFNSTTDSPTSGARSNTIVSNGAWFSNDSTDNTTNVLANAISIASGRFGVIHTDRPINTTGTITGAGKLYKTGGSTSMRQWAINNDNTGAFTGTIELQDGQIMVRSTGAIPTGSTLIFNPTSNVNGVALNAPSSVTVGATLEFQRTSSGIHQFINVGGNETLTLSGNFSNTGNGTAGYIGVGPGNGNVTNSGGGFAVGNSTGVATISFTGTGTLANPIGIRNASNTTAVLSLGNTAGTQTFTGNITGDGALVRNGAGGTTILSGNNSYNGTTTVTAGTLLINGSHSGGGNYSVTGVLGGSGTITPASAASFTVNSGGVIAPGSVAATGNLTFDGINRIGVVATFSTGAKFAFDLNATDLTSDKIQLNNGASGDFVFNNNVIDFSLLSGTLANGQTYTLFSATAANNYSGLTVDGNNIITAGLSIGTGLTGFSESYLSLNGSDIQLNVIPEPSSFALLAGGLAALAIYRRRRA